jgi:hypothetical protein
MAERFPLSVSRWIDAALKGSGWTAEEVLKGVQHGDFHLFSHEHGCVVSEFIVSPRHKVMHVWAAGGDVGRGLQVIDDLMPTLEAFGRRHGCDTGGATGRKGWLRYLKRYGYEPASPAVSKEL